MKSLQEALNYRPNELKFGTSGLRAMVSEMTDLGCYINTLGFMHFLQVHDGVQPGEVIYLAGDLRDSSPRIMRAAYQAMVDTGLKVVNCGLILTPVVANYAAVRRAACVMVTGSHIPADRNGIKFYKRIAEIMKEDEPAIMEAVAKVRKRLYSQDERVSIFDQSGMFKKQPSCQM